MTRLHFAYCRSGFSDSACFHCPQLRVDHSGSYVSSAVDTIAHYLVEAFFVGGFMRVLDRCITDASSFQGQVLFLIPMHSVYCTGTLCDFSLQSKPVME